MRHAPTGRQSSTPARDGLEAGIPMSRQPVRRTWTPTVRGMALPAWLPVAPPGVPQPQVWWLAQQRLKAELTSAQYSSWLANTDLYRRPDGFLVLVTRSTFAAEHIAQRWGERIAWVLSQVTGQRCPLEVRPWRPRDGRPRGESQGHLMVAPERGALAMPAALPPVRMASRSDPVP
jgi:hypothetical protein